ncbi:hypothetical protein HanPI659440_Chr08g0280271 [Helianthus annuus]|nr:hypothetical protein HanPI659440_Chr08g0280271 [Helianthus annuus]
MFLFHSVPPKNEHRPFYLYCSPGFSLNPSKVASKSSNQLKPLLNCGRGFIKRALCARRNKAQGLGLFCFSPCVITGSDQKAHFLMFFCGLFGLRRAPHVT